MRESITVGMSRPVPRTSIAYTPVMESTTVPHDLTLITTLAAALGLALVLGFLATKLRLPALPGS
jgi:hypothetical protein